MCVSESVCVPVSKIEREIKRNNLRKQITVPLREAYS